MREIKFRAWVKDLNKMVEILQIDLQYNNVLFRTKENGKDERRMFNQVELMQYTGLKDKNGKEIYEGDIIKQELEYKKHFKYCINYSEYYNALCCFKHGIKGYSYPQEMAGFNSKQNKIEIIGNIYENPELLEEIWKD